MTYCARRGGKNANHHRLISETNKAYLDRSSCESSCEEAAACAFVVGNGRVRNNVPISMSDTNERNAHLLVSSFLEAKYTIPVPEPMVVDVDVDAIGTSSLGGGGTSL